MEHKEKSYLWLDCLAECRVGGNVCGEWILSGFQRVPSMIRYSLHGTLITDHQATNSQMLTCLSSYLVGGPPGRRDKHFSHSEKGMFFIISEFTSKCSKKIVSPNFGGGASYSWESHRPYFEVLSILWIEKMLKHSYKTCGVFSLFALNPLWLFM